MYLINPHEILVGIFPTMQKNKDNFKMLGNETSLFFIIEEKNLLR